MKKLYENLENKHENYISPFLWLHGEDVNMVIDEIDKINAVGIKEICLESRTYEDFCGESWWRDLAVIFEECQKRDMGVWILDDKHFPSGYANGVIDREYKHLKKWDIIERHVDVLGPIKDGAVISKQWLWDVENDEILSTAAYKKDENGKLCTEALDITKNIREGMVYFDLPEGCFRIVFLVKTRFFMGKYYEGFSDKLNPEATDAYIKEVYQPHYEHFAKYFGNTFRGFFSDEPGFENNRARGGLSTELGADWQEYPWHERVYDRLYEKYGEDTYKKLALLWFEDKENEYAEVRYNYMDIITDEYRKNFTSKIGDWCREHGILYIGHIIEDEDTHAKTGSGPGHYFRAMQGQDMAGVDVVLHQIIPGMKDYSNACSTSYLNTSNKLYNYVLAKLAASDAVQDKLKNNKAMCELFGAYGWAEGTKIMKYLADHMIMRGINHFVPHAFSPKEDDKDCPPTFYNRGKNPMYSYLDIIMNYMNRITNVISDTQRVTRCAIVYDAEAIWCGGEYVKNEDVAKELWDNQIDYDFISEDNLLCSDIKDGRVCVGNGAYTHIIVPYRKYITPVLKNSVEKLIQKGVNVIFAGGRPERDIYHEAVEICGGIDCGVEEIAKRLEMLCEFESVSEHFLAVAHYKNDEKDIYLFANENARAEINKTIKLKNKSIDKYYIYDPIENKLYKREEKEIRLSISPYNCIAIIIGDVDEKYLSDEKEYLQKTEISPRCNVSVCRDIRSGDFEAYAGLDKLENITGKSGIDNFGGVIRYSFDLSVETDGMYDLSFENLGEAAKIYVDNKLCGKRAVPPYVFDLGELNKGRVYKIVAEVATHDGYKYQDEFSRYLLFEPMGISGKTMLKRYK